MATQERTFCYLAIISALSMSSSATPGQIRLMGPGSTLCSGRVEIYHNNSWERICDGNWGPNNAKVVCRQLNCGTVLSDLKSPHFGQGTGQIWFANVTCYGNESSLTECQHGGSGKHNCGDNEDVVIACSVPWLLPVSSVSAVILLILLVLLVVCLVLRRRRRAKQFEDHVQPQITVTNHYEDDDEDDDEDEDEEQEAEEEDEERDYVNVDPIDREQAEQTEEENDTDSFDYVNMEPNDTTRCSVTKEDNREEDTGKEESSNDEDDYVNVTEQCIEQTVDIYGHEENVYQNF